ncbi:MAG TPA: hypothetical protein VE443_02435, partial [Beijerinckiaceae bacterium]|nr:hypothetical protein [Beijerinckiaceae bacterium]
PCNIGECNDGRAYALTRAIVGARPMPRFYFDLVLDGKAERDAEGVELNAARAEAVRAATDIAKDYAGKHPNHDLMIRVRSEERQRVATARLSLRVE